MAAARRATSRVKAKPKLLRFELTRSAVLGVAVVVFCLFLWMFLLGVWTGQTLLQPALDKAAVMHFDGNNGGEAADEPIIIRAVKKAFKR